MVHALHHQPLLIPRGTLQATDHVRLPYPRVLPMFVVTSGTHNLNSEVQTSPAFQSDYLRCCAADPNIISFEIHVPKRGHRVVVRWLSLESYAADANRCLS